MHHNAFIVLAMQIFYRHLYSYFGINISFAVPKEEFGEDDFHRGITFNFHSLIWKILMIFMFFVIGGRWK